MTTAEAVATLRSRPELGELLRDSYLDTGTDGYWQRFGESAEFAAILQLVGGEITGLRVLDVGAGVGMASLAFAQAGAAFVCALEPDGSDVVGYRCLHNRPADGLDVTVVSGIGEFLPFPAESFDIVYCRQVLHHARDLRLMVKELARVTRRGGCVLATREHVVRNDRELTKFLRSHPLHVMTGQEHAYRLRTYEQAFEGAGFTAPRVLRPLDTVINAFPRARSEAEVAALPALWLERFGVLGRVLDGLAWTDRWVRALAVRRVPGSMYSFVATRP